MQACAPFAPNSCTPSASSGFLEGRVLAGRYRVGQAIGSGAMGRVFAAEHIDLGRPCAVKVIRGDDGEGEKRDRQEHQEAVARFRTEALAASRMDHPNVLRVLDFGREPDGMHYLVSEHLDGIDLVDLAAQDERLSLPRVVKMVRQVCSALQHAHNRGVVHRDIKPENVRLVRREGDDGSLNEVVKLLDFGTAFLVDGTAPSGRLVIGTPAYMSPEQANGDPVDARTDIYSVGVLLFELATGRLPFERSSAIALAAAHIECPPPDPSSIDERVGTDLERIILWCLQKDPERRPQSARALRDALDGWLAEHAQESLPRGSEPEITVELAAAPRTAKVRRLRPRAVAVLVAATLGAAAAVVLRVAPISFDTADAAELPHAAIAAAVPSSNPTATRETEPTPTITPSATNEITTPRSGNQAEATARIQTSGAKPLQITSKSSLPRAIADPAVASATDKPNLTEPPAPRGEVAPPVETTSIGERPETTTAVSAATPHPYAPEGI